MAMAYPEMVKEVMGRGHTMGTHTWSHPLNLRGQSLDRAKDQIERGFAAVALAAGDKPIAPFFRFPGLSDSGAMLAYLQGRGIAAFTVDVVSNDSFIGSPQRLVQRTLDQVEKQNGGIVLFHDIKASTAKALPTILTELKKRGYKVVHMRSKSPFAPLPELTAELEAKRAKIAAKEGKKGRRQAEARPVLRGDQPRRARDPYRAGGDGAGADRARAHARGRNARDGGGGARHAGCDCKRATRPSSRRSARASIAPAGLAGAPARSSRSPISGS